MNRVLLEGSIFSKQVANGISNYLSKLLEHERSRPHPDISCRVLVTKGYEENLFIRELALPKESTIDSGPVKFLTQMSSGGLLPACEIFHSPYMFLPPKSKDRINVLTVHDLINFERHSGVRNNLRKSLLALAISRADQFICISEHTKEKLLQFFPALDRNSIHVIYQGVDQVFLTPMSQPNPESRDPYVLYVGLRTGYKNFRALVEFFKDSPWRNRLQIICVGGGSFTEEEKSVFMNYGLAEKINHAGFVSTFQLRDLYSQAFVLAYTSLAEGFGLPIIEAMASGCPVICGDFSAMKEVAGNKAILVNDFSPQNLEAAFNTAGGFSITAKSEARIHASGFTWDKTGQRTFDLYRQLS
jgi:glycosyltransferase involved in cell wall biosynthesis